MGDAGDDYNKACAKAVAVRDRAWVEALVVRGKAIREAEAVFKASTKAVAEALVVRGKAIREAEAVFVKASNDRKAVFVKACNEAYDVYEKNKDK